MLIHGLLLTTLETALSHFIRLDPDAELFLEPLSGKVIQLDLLNPDLTVFLCPTTKRHTNTGKLSGNTGHTFTRFGYGFRGNGLSEIVLWMLCLPEKLPVSGDVNTSRDFQNLFERLEIDWEEQISRLTGDVVGHQIGRLFRSAKKLEPRIG